MKDKIGCFFLLVQASMCQRSCNLSWQSHTQEYMYLNLKDVKLNLNVICDLPNGNVLHKT